MKKKSALLIGASGLVGNELLSILLDSEAYSQVEIFTRSPLNITHPKLIQIVIDFDRLDNYYDHFQIEDVFVCLGTTIKKAGTQEAFKKVDYEYPFKLASLSKKAGVVRFLIITAMGANPHSKVFYNRVKGETEAEIKKIGLPILHIFQPSLLVGNRKEFRLGEQLGIWLSPLFSFFLVGRLRQYKPIKAKDVASAMYNAAQMSSKGNHTHKSDQILVISKE